MIRGNTNHSFLRYHLVTAGRIYRFLPVKLGIKCRVKHRVPRRLLLDMVRCSFLTFPAENSVHMLSLSSPLVLKFGPT